MVINSKKFNQSISIIFPAYNEEKNIEGTISDALSFARENFHDFEIIVVNDGSKDKTLEVSQKIAQSEKNVKVLNNASNLGYGATVWKGLKAATKDLIFFSDADRQFDLKEISRVLDKIDQFDVVIGYRSQRKDPYIRKVNAYLWKVLIRSMLSLKVRDIDCAFKLFKKEVIDKIKVKSTGATFSAELIYQIKKYNFAVLEIAVTHYPRLEGKPTGAKISVIKRALAEFWQFYLSEPKLVKDKSRYAYWGGAISLLLSRLLLMSNSVDFFDSTQYVARTTESTLMKALTNGHPPFHPLYIFFSNIFYKLQLADTPITASILPSAILGTGSIIFFFLIVRKLFNSRVAWLATIIYALFPFIYISQITSMVDPTMHFFFFLSLLLFVLAFENFNKRTLFVFSILSGLSLGLAALAHTQVAFWAISFVGVFIAINKSWQKKDLLRIALAAILFCLCALSSVFIYAKLLIYSNAHGYIDMGIYSFREAIKFLAFGNVGDRSPISLLEIFNRLLSLSSILVGFLGAVGLIAMFFSKNYKKAIMLAIWILPSLITASYIYENLHGRAMMLALAPISIAVAYLVLRSKKWGYLIFLLVLAQLLILSVPQVVRYRLHQGANESLAELQKSSLAGGVFSSSNVTRTWSSYNGRFINFGDVGTGAGDVYKASLQAIENDKPAYISSDAIYHPFWRYDGENFDIRSSGIGGASDHQSLLYEVFTKLNVNIDRASGEFKQAVYTLNSSRGNDIYDKISEIAKTQPVVFGQVKSNGKVVSDMSVNLYGKQLCRVTSGDLTRLDFVRCIYRTIRYPDSLQNWSFTDKDGWFYVPGENASAKVVLGPISTEARSSDLAGSFAKQEPVDITSDNFVTFDNIVDLQAKIASLDGSFYVVANSVNSKIIFELHEIGFTLEKTNRIEAENMSGEVGESIGYSSASKHAVRYNSGKRSGYMVSGPYVDLPEGKYKLNFSILAKEIKDENSTVTIDVTSSQSGEGFGTREFKASELTDGFTSKTINFELNNDTKALEFRVRTSGAAEVFVDYLELN